MRKQRYLNTVIAGGRNDMVFKFIFLSSSILKFDHLVWLYQKQVCHDRNCGNPHNGTVKHLCRFLSVAASSISPFESAERAIYKKKITLRVKDKWKKTTAIFLSTYQLFSLKVMLLEYVGSEIISTGLRFLSIECQQTHALLRKITTRKSS